VAAEGFKLLPVTGRHAVRAALFSDLHSDLFDRILAMQAEIEELIVGTNDNRFEVSGTRTVWASSPRGHEAPLKEIAASLWRRLPHFATIMHPLFGSDKHDETHHRPSRVT
jgi:hypothetical protein